MTIETLERSAVIEAAPATIAVVVTQDDIDQGEQNSGRNCAISLAFERLGVRAAVGWRGNAMLAGSEYVCRSARTWVRDFDRDKARVHPERFVWHRVDHHDPANWCGTYIPWRTAAVIEANGERRSE